MGNNLPPGVGVNDLPGSEPVRDGGVEDTRNYGDEAECAVCGKPLDRAPHVEGLDLCDTHTEEDYREKISAEAEVRDEEMTVRQKKNEEQYAEQQNYINER